MNFDDRLKLEHSENWKKIKDKLPFFNFDENWLVKIIPPYLGVMVRFIIADKDLNEFDSKNFVSIYYDEYGFLGSAIQYWEIRLGLNGQTSRFYLNDTEGITSEIREFFNNLKQGKK